MRNIAILASFVLAPSAFAHMFVGTYTGLTRAGDACSFNVSEVRHEESRHPLNERVTITVEGETFTLSHPAVVDEAAGKVAFNHDLLSGAKGRGKVFMSATIKMDHSEGKDGPAEIVFIRDNHESISATENKWTCGALVAPTQGM